jgi:hypothetical protein
MRAKRKCLWFSRTRARIPNEERNGLSGVAVGIGKHRIAQRDKPPLANSSNQANPSLGSGSGTNGSSQHGLITQLCRPVGYLHIYRTIQHRPGAKTPLVTSCLFAPAELDAKSNLRRHGEDGGHADHLLMEPRKPNLEHGPLSNDTTSKLAPLLKIRLGRSAL